ncbi:efflux transporter outer membrane subunit [Caenimonas soli]|uniref:efflux transporter outer membrane subunit n=1 Tax=Caenimonas soli TaxID=2735555 RepID=UPI0015545763|nr:efflux transporter outer membrane subunit [Caenimonas soli]NPC56969.1 efflux transporter outer membrane subunit [Caenimonas soli]
MNLKTNPRLLALAAAALLAGCSMMPVYERPQAPVPAGWDDASATEGAPAAVLDWQQFFANDNLRGLIATALRNNRDLRVAVLNIEQARAQYDIRNADRFPSVSGAVSGSRAPASGGGTASTYTAGLLVSAWEIDFFGRIASLSEAAVAQYLATEEGRKAAQMSLVASVANSWLNLVADEELLALTRQTLATREESLRLTRLRFDSGVSSELDFQQAQSLTESARVALTQQQRQRALDFNTLRLLLGEAPPADASGKAALATLTLPDVPAGLPSDVLVRRPDVRQAEQLLVAANANIGAARAAFFPRITLTAGIGTASNELSGLFKGGSWGLTVAPQLLQPIFDAGRNRAGLRSANVSRDIAVAQYEKAIQSAFREVSDALAGRATLADQLTAQNNVAQAEAVRLRLSTLRYESGVSSFLELLDAQRSLFAARQAQIQTRLQLLQNQVLLYRALGGGWSEPSM